MGVEAYLSWEIRDSRGRVIDRGRKRAESFVQGFIGLLCNKMAQTSITIKDTGGTDRSTPASNVTLAVNAGVGVITFGVVVGTGTNAVAITDYALQTLIAHGTGAGQLSYGAVSVTDWVQAGADCYFTVARTVTNNSGGSITVEEVGLYTKYGSYYVCSDRTLLTKAIADAASATFTYTVKATV